MDPKSCGKSCIFFCGTKFFWWYFPLPNREQVQNFPTESKTLAIGKWAKKKNFEPELASKKIKFHYHKKRTFDFTWEDSKKTKNTRKQGQPN